MSFRDWRVDPNFYALIFAFKNYLGYQLYLTGHAFFFLL